jgi:hypothetical protein
MKVPGMMGTGGEVAEVREHRRVSPALRRARNRDGVNAVTRMRLRVMPSKLGCCELPFSTVYDPFLV